MDKDELKNLKKKYKKAVLCEEEDACELESLLKGELAEKWDDFLMDVNQSAAKARTLGEEAYEAARKSNRDRGLLTQDVFEKKAKSLGAGAWPYVRRQWKKGEEARQDSLRTLGQKDTRPIQAELPTEVQAAESMASPAPKPVRVSASSQRKMTKEEVRAAGLDREKSFPARQLHKVNIVAVPAVKAPIPEFPSRLFLKEVMSGFRLQTSHPNDITNLKPVADWTVCVDESFDKNEEEFRTDGEGVIAGIAFPNENPLPKVEQLHVTENFREPDLQAADRIVEGITHHPNCGVLAFPAKVQEISLGWADMVCTLADILIRFLPFPEDAGRVSVTFLVEPHGGYQNNQDFRALDERCLKSIKDSCPQLADRLRVSFESLPKDVLGETYNPYGDVVAHTCRMRHVCQTAEQRYLNSGWEGSCFFHVKSQAFSSLLNCLYFKERLDATTWAAVAACPKIGLAHGLRTYYGKRAKGDVSEWLAYLGYLDEHRLSNTVNMRLLREEVDWMEEFYPNAEIAPLDRLTWLTIKLAKSNHEGKLVYGPEDPLRCEFDDLCERLFDESASRVCDAVLNLAVSYTNAFQFEMALGVIQSLLAEKAATVGRAYYGKLLSTEGQHFAFLGDGKASIERFIKALTVFDGLSNPKDREINKSITSGYLTTAMMDHCPEEEALAQLKAYLTGMENAPDEVVEQRVRTLATSCEAKYQHHILLRYAVEAGREDIIRKTYRAVWKSWCDPADGHPWELIEFYRGVLVSSWQEREQHYQKALDLARQEGGETVMVIAAVIAGAALTEDRQGKWIKRFNDLLEKLKGISGLSGEEGRYQVLLDQPKALLPPLELARKVLPFNFR